MLPKKGAFCLFVFVISFSAAYCDEDDETSGYDDLVLPPDSIIQDNGLSPGYWTKDSEEVSKSAEPKGLQKVEYRRLLNTDREFSLDERNRLLQTLVADIKTENATFCQLLDKIIKSLGNIKGGGCILSKPSLLQFPGLQIFNPNYLQSQYPGQFSGGYLSRTQVLNPKPFTYQPGAPRSQFTYGPYPSGKFTYVTWPEDSSDIEAPQHAYSFQFPRRPIKYKSTIIPGVEPGTGILNNKLLHRPLSEGRYPYDSAVVNPNFNFPSIGEVPIDVLRPSRRKRPNKLQGSPEINLGFTYPSHGFNQRPIYSQKITAGNPKLTFGVPGYSGNGWVDSETILKPSGPGYPPRQPEHHIHSNKKPLRPGKENYYPLIQGSRFSILQRPKIKSEYYYYKRPRPIQLGPFWRPTKPGIGFAIKQRPNVFPGMNLVLNPRPNIPTDSDYVDEAFVPNKPGDIYNDVSSVPNGRPGLKLPIALVDALKLKPGTKLILKPGPNTKIDGDNVDETSVPTKPDDNNENASSLPNQKSEPKLPVELVDTLNLKPGVKLPKVNKPKAETKYQPHPKPLKKPSTYRKSGERWSLFESLSRKTGHALPKSATGIKFLEMNNPKIQTGYQLHLKPFITPSSNWKSGVKLPVANVLKIESGEDTPKIKTGNDSVDAPSVPNQKPEHKLTEENKPQAETSTIFDESGPDTPKAETELNEPAAKISKEGAVNVAGPEIPKVDTGTNVPVLDAQKVETVSSATVPPPDITSVYGPGITSPLDLTTGSSNSGVDAPKVEKVTNAPLVGSRKAESVINAPMLDSQKVETDDNDEEDPSFAYSGGPFPITYFPITDSSKIETDDVDVDLPSGPSQKPVFNVSSGNATKIETLINLPLTDMPKNETAHAYPPGQPSAESDAILLKNSLPTEKLDYPLLKGSNLLKIEKSLETKNPEFKAPKVELPSKEDADILVPRMHIPMLFKPGVSISNLKIPISKLGHKLPNYISSKLKTKFNIPKLKILSRPQLEFTGSKYQILSKPGLISKLKSRFPSKLVFKASKVQRPSSLNLEFTAPKFVISSKPGGSLSRVKFPPDTNLEFSGPKFQISSKPGVSLSKINPLTVSKTVYNVPKLELPSEPKLEYTGPKFHFKPGASISQIQLPSVSKLVYNGPKIELPSGPKLAYTGSKFHIMPKLKSGGLINLPSATKLEYTGPKFHLAPNFKPGVSTSQIKLPSGPKLEFEVPSSRSKLVYTAPKFQITSKLKPGVSISEIKQPSAPKLEMFLNPTGKYTVEKHWPNLGTGELNLSLIPKRLKPGFKPTPKPDYDIQEDGILQPGQVTVPAKVTYYTSGQTITYLPSNISGLPAGVTFHVPKRKQTEFIVSKPIFSHLSIQRGKPSATVNTGNVLHVKYPPKKSQTTHSEQQAKLDFSYPLKSRNGKVKLQFKEKLVTSPPNTKPGKQYIVTSTKTQGPVGSIKYSKINFPQGLSQGQLQGSIDYSKLNIPQGAMQFQGDLDYSKFSFPQGMLSTQGQASLDYSKLNFPQGSIDYKFKFPQGVAYQNTPDVSGYYSFIPGVSQTASVQHSGPLLKSSSITTGFKQSGGASSGQPWQKFSYTVSSSGGLPIGRSVYDYPYNDTNMPLKTISISLRQKPGEVKSLDMTKLNDVKLTISRDGKVQPVPTFRASIKRGLGGVTVATFHPSEKIFIIKERNIYTCNGTISKKNGECSGALKNITRNKFEDNCFVNDFPRVDDYGCLSSSSEPIYMTYYSNKILCETNSQDALFMKYSSINDLCKSLATEASYKFYTNGSIDSKFACEGKTPAVCTLTENLVLSDKSDVPLNF